MCKKDWVIYSKVLEVTDFENVFYPSLGYQKFVKKKNENIRKRDELN